MVSPGRQLAGAGAARWQIGPAQPEDIPALCELLALLFAQEVEFTPERSAQARGLAMIIGQPQLGVVLVARNPAFPGRLSGMVNLLYTISTALGERVALLEDLVVAPAERNAGLGSQLLQQAIDVARANACRRITLLTDQANSAAQRFYAGHGFCASTMLPLRLMLK